MVGKYKSCVVYRGEIPVQACIFIIFSKTFFLKGFQINDDLALLQKFKLVFSNVHGNFNVCMPMTMAEFAIMYHFTSYRIEYK